VYCGSIVAVKDIRYYVKNVVDDFKKKWLRQESNLDLELRKLLYYPLYYGAILKRSAKVRFLWVMPTITDY